MSKFRSFRKGRGRKRGRSRRIRKIRLSRGGFRI